MISVSKDTMQKILFYVVNISLLFIYILPFATVFYPDISGEDSGTWINLFLWEDEIVLMAYLIYTVIWGAYLFFNHTKIIGVILGILSLLYFFYSLLSAGAQDYIPGYGVCIALIHHLVMIIYLYRDQLNKKENTTTNTSV